METSQNEGLPNAIPPLTPLAPTLELTPISDLLSKSFEIYWSRFKKFTQLELLGLLAFVPIGVLATLYLVISSILQKSAAITISFFVISFVTVIFSIIFAIVTQVAMYFYLNDLKIDTKIKDLLLLAKSRAFHFWSTSILVGLVVIAGFIFLVVPGIIFAVALSMTAYVYVFEGLQDTQALQRSRELVRGYWWPVAIRLLTALLISYAIQVPRYFLGDGVDGAIYSLFEIVARLIFYPWFIVYSFLIYRDLYKIKGASQSENKKSKFGMVILVIFCAIFILGLFASFMLVSLDSARMKSRDAKRISDINQIRVALGIYRNDKNKYPEQLTELSQFGLDISKDVDPKTKASYEYILDKDDYKLCFNLEEAKTVGVRNYQKGKNCINSKNEIDVNNFDSVQDNQ